jgi:hypothetical protein
MKTQIFKTVLLFILINSSVSVYSFTTHSDPVVTTATVKEVRGQYLLERLKEIRAVDKSELSHEERKALRKELRAIREELSTDHRGIYLSFGAAIIILLLLILIV